MKRIKPSVYLVSKPQVHRTGQFGLNAFLRDIGVETTYDPEGSDAEQLCETMGRLCYNSFAPGLNPNVKRIREDSEAYHGNVIESGHGSVLEHANFSFILRNVSRVVTHELVRHRAGCAYSQESLRFVRLTDLRYFLPDEFGEGSDVAALFRQVIGSLEKQQLELAQRLDLDNVPMARRKALTSMMRRIAPIGLATTIGFTANIRALRHIIEMRSSRHAEIEIRLVANELASLLKFEVPFLLQDMEESELVDGIPEYTFRNEKV